MINREYKNHALESNPRFFGDFQINARRSSSAVFESTVLLATQTPCDQLSLETVRELFPKFGHLDDHIISQLQAIFSSFCHIPPRESFGKFANQYVSPRDGRSRRRNVYLLKNIRAKSFGDAIQDICIKVEKVFWGQLVARQ